MASIQQLLYRPPLQRLFPFNASLEKGLVHEDTDSISSPHIRNNHCETGLRREMTAGSTLKAVNAAGSISIPPELFEELYLWPQTCSVRLLILLYYIANLLNRGLLGYLLSLGPLSYDLMGWRGTTNGDAGIATYFFFGGLLMVLGGIGEVMISSSNL